MNVHQALVFMETALMKLEVTAVNVTLVHRTLGLTVIKR